MKNKLNQISRKIEEINRIKTEVAQAINNLPDNPNINRINQKCFIMSSAQLAGKDNPTARMDVIYHDFKKQYQIIAIILDHSKEQNPLPVLQNIIQTHTYKCGNDYYRFHPTVIKHLATLIA